MDYRQRNYHRHYFSIPGRTWRTTRAFINPVYLDLEMG